jgi:hypothetical protein
MAGWEQWILHVADCHFDSVFCAREVMEEQFQEAKNRNARINIYGDFLDAMQGRFDPRRSMAELRPEYRREDYYDFVISDAAEWLAPYAANIDLMADGNHELAVLKAASTNLMDRLVDRLRLNNKKCRAVHGGYGGWIRYMFNISTTLTSIRLKYYHGASASGGDAPVTRGVIQTARQAVYLPDANIVVNGHSHNSYYVPIARERLSNKGQQYFDTQHHIRTPGYKQSYGDGSTGWDVTRGAPPKPIGSIWTRLYCIKHEEGSSIGVQVIPNIRDPQPIRVDSGELYGGAVYAEDTEGE